MQRWEIEKAEDNDGLIQMCDMKPCEIGVIQGSGHHGEYVMRTASAFKFEVMSISKPKEEHCWTNPTVPLKVRLLKSGESIKITIL